jgi:5'-nucleotidase
MSNPKSPNFLLTNDDGIDAPGLKALIHLMQRFGNLYTVGPAEALSGCGHQVSGKLPIKVEKLATTNPKEIKRWTAHGTPADCVRLGLNALLKGISIDYVVSGINAGGNLGVDIYTSGTLAAAREATIWGTPGIALSHHIRGREIDWNLATKRGVNVMKSILDKRNEPKVYWNINLPHIQTEEIQLDIVNCPVDNNPSHVEFEEIEGSIFANKGNYNLRSKTPGSDISTCFEGKISVTRLVI